MIESGIIAEGSMKGFISGTHFNRCKQIHVAVALALKVLHFKAFLEEYESSIGDQMTLEETVELLEDEENFCIRTEDLQKKLRVILDKYSSYTRGTLDGVHGYTAKIALMYVRFIEKYQLFEYAIRTSDVDLYINAANDMCPLFFTFNHQNYARWLTRHLDDLINMEMTHPGLSEEFSNGSLSVRRTKNQFCRSAVDLTLEQTINANAANKLKGISAFTNSVDARQKWSETHSVRTAIITRLFDFLGLNKISECQKDYKSKLFKDRFTKFTAEICQNINPFNCDLNREKLFNLSTGKAASSETTEFLSNVETIGIEQMQAFIRECKVDASRFERPLRKNVIKNFSSEIFKNKQSSIKNITDTKYEKNILGHILCLSLKEKIDLASIFSYPLTAVPHSLAHFDGSMLSNNNQKAEFINLMLSKIDVPQNNSPAAFDVDVIDGFYLLENLREPPMKYGAFASMVLENICSTNAREVHLIFHKDQSPSPGDVNMKKHRELYENSTINFKIKGPNQERSSNLKNCLISSSFRNEIVQFLVDHWKDAPCTLEILGTKRLFVSFGSLCYFFCNDYEKGKVLPLFENNHFDVESKMIMHMSRIRELNIRVKIKNPELISIISLYHMKFWPNGKRLWIETGDVSKNTHRLINVRQIFDLLTPTMIDALPGWYAFTGCQYEPSFFGKGRKTCLKILEKSNEFQTAFGNFGISASVGEDYILSVEEFTCQLYGLKEKDVNNARATSFMKGYGTKNAIDFKKNGNSSNLY